MLYCSGLMAPADLESLLLSDPSVADCVAEWGGWSGDMHVLYCPGGSC